MYLPHLHYDTLSSTNDLAKTIGRFTGPHVFPKGLCISADVQTSGRGQFERRWVSPPGGVYFSFLSFRPPSSLLRSEEGNDLKGRRWSLSVAEGFDPSEAATPGQSPQAAGLGNLGSKGRQPLELSPVSLRSNAAQRNEEIPYLIGLRLQSWLSKNFQIEAHVKPPNDLLVNGRKLCGILVEKVSRGEVSFWVVGIGLNLNQELFPDFLPDATSLSLLSGKTYDNYAIIESLIEECVLWFGA